MNADRNALDKMRRRLKDLAREIEKNSEMLSETALVTASAISECNGVIVCAGVGKSAFIANKFAATLRSIGVRAVFISGLEAMHGDLGILRPNDELVMVSNSGETEELISLAAEAKKKGCRVTVLVGNEESQLAREADEVIGFESAKELDYLKILPTASTSITLSILDTIACEVAELVGYSEKTFASNHPGGLLGHVHGTRVSEVMHQLTEVGSVDEGASLQDASIQLTKFPLGILWVTDKGSFAGVLTDGDVRRALAASENPISDKVRQHLSLNPVTLEANDTVNTAKNKLASGPFGRPISAAPVLSRGEIVGVVTQNSLEYYRKKLGQ